MHRLGGNSLRDEGAIAVCNALKESKVSKLAYLDLEYNGIGADGAKAIAAYCAVSASLTSLNVSHNGIIGEAAQELATVVLGKQSLEHFCEIPLKELRADSLTELDLMGKGVGVPGALVLAELLRTVSSSLTNLS